MSLYTLVALPGKYAREPGTGAYRRTKIRAIELCDHAQDFRRYSVIETCGHSTVRRTDLDCGDYFDLSPAESARALARRWAEEARQDTEQRRAAGETLIAID